MPNHTLGLVGRLAGRMTRVFTDDGESHPCSVVSVSPNRITQIKTKEIDGYDAVQITIGTQKPSRITKALKGHLEKAGVEPGRGLWEFRLAAEPDTAYSAGGSITVDIFSEGQFVDVTGTSKGKGFAGAIKRHNFSMQDATHGNSLSHRAPGSIGQNQTPGRVFKGKKMAGQMGNKRRTVQNLQILAVDKERHLILIKGGVPGAPGGTVIIKPSVKAKQVEA